MTKVFGAALLLSMTALPLSAQQATDQTSKPKPLPPACSTDNHRAFDFWIGDWDVTSAGQEEPNGRNNISAAHGGCVIKEEYQTKGGYTGSSISFYDAQRKMWHQSWMGLDGTALYIEGGLNEAGEMVLSNKNWPGFKEGSQINQVTWTPNKDGSVRQHWQTSRDDGKSWRTLFDGTYRKRASTEE